MRRKNKMNPFWGEVIGTMILVLLGNGVVAGVNLKKTFSNGAGWVVITIAWGLGVTLGIYAVGNFSEAHLNPAVTLGMAMMGTFSWGDVPGYILAQIIGGILGAIIVYFHYLPHWKMTEEPATKLGVFVTGPAIPHAVGNLLSEIIGTFFLIIGLLTIGANDFADGLNPLAVGLLIVAIGMSLGGTTGYAINPARDLGPRIAHFILPIPGKGPSNWKYAPVPIIGPFIGAGLAAVFYRAVYLGEVTIAFWIMLILLTVTLFIAKRIDKRRSIQQ